jgi:DNA polymerase III epsilon subunit-like protein
MKTQQKIRYSLNKIIVFDLETTGLPGQAEIIEIGAIKYNRIGKKNKIIQVFNERVKPQTEYWSEAAAQTHKIKKTQLKNCRTIEQVLPDFLKFLENKYIVVGHRLAFDCTFIRDFCKVCGLEIPVNPVLDTYKIAKKVLEIDKIIAKQKFKKFYNVHLKDLIKYFNVTCTLANNHRAYVDAMLTGELFYKMCQGFKISELLPETFDKIEFVLDHSSLKEKKTNGNKSD